MSYDHDNWAVSPSALATRSLRPSTLETSHGTVPKSYPR